MRVVCHSGIRYNTDGSTKDGGLTFIMIRVRPGYESAPDSPWYTETSYLYDHTIQVSPGVFECRDFDVSALVD